MTGVNVGRTPINKGITVTTAMKEIRRVASLHRNHPIFIYDEMFNLVTWYPSISVFRRKTGRFTRAYAEK